MSSGLTFLQQCTSADWQWSLTPLLLSQSDAHLRAGTVITRDEYGFWRPFLIDGPPAGAVLTSDVPPMHQRGMAIRAACMIPSKLIQLPSDQRAEFLHEVTTQLAALPDPVFIVQ